MIIIKIMIITIEKEVTSRKNAKVIFENLTARTFKQSLYKNEFH